MKARFFFLLLLSCVLVLAAAQQIITPGADITAAAGRDMINAKFTELYARADIRSNGRNIYTSAQFQAALLESGPITLHLRADITLTAIHTVGTDKVIIPDNYRFIQGGSGGLICMGTLDKGRDQVFSGFVAGDITGTFGSNLAYPEWWGLTDGRHDVAINCAVKAARLVSSGFGLRVSLATRVYDVAAPIDLASTAVALVGSGRNLTFLRATSAWDATWVKAEQWGAPGDPANHAAMVWIGAEIGSAFSYSTKVMGMDIECHNASFAHRAGGLKRVSGISSKAGVEECSLIHDVVVTNASGFGIGFCRHKPPAGSFSAATVNGLDISGCWITSPTFRDAVGLHFSQWTNNCSVRCTTVDMGLHKSISSAHAAIGGGDSVIYPAPTWIRDYPLAAIVAQGFVTLTDIHIEGAIIGVLIQQCSGASNVTATNVKTIYMMDEALGAIYKADGLSGAKPAANTANFGYGCAVLIAGEGTGNDNLKDCVTLNSISTRGECPYLVRDSVYGVERTMYEMGQFPAGALAGRIAFYTRGNAYIGAGGGATYNKAAPSTDRTYFTGPIY